MVASVLEFPDPKTIWRLDFTIPVDGPVRIKKLVISEVFDQSSILITGGTG